MILNKTGVQKHAASMHNNYVALIRCSTEVTLFVEIHWEDGNFKDETGLLSFVHSPFQMLMPILMLTGLRIFYPVPFLQILRLDFNNSQESERLNNLLSSTVSFIKIKILDSLLQKTLFSFPVPPILLVINVCVFVKLVHHSPCVKTVVLGFLLLGVFVCSGWGG